MRQSEAQREAFHAVAILAGVAGDEFSLGFFTGLSRSTGIPQWTNEPQSRNAGTTRRVETPYAIKAECESHTQRRGKIGNTSITSLPCSIVLERPRATRVQLISRQVMTTAYSGSLNGALTVTPW